MQFIIAEKTWLRPCQGVANIRKGEFYCKPRFQDFKMIRNVFSKNLRHLSAPCHVSSVRLNSTRYSNLGELLLGVSPNARPLALEAAVGCQTNVLSRLCNANQRIGVLPCSNTLSIRHYNKQKTIKIPPTKPLHFDYSGDLVKTLNSLDLKEPKVDYKDSEELEGADDTLKKLFSLEFADGREILKKHMDETIGKIQQHPADVASLEAKIARLTVHIRNQMRHVLDFRKDKVGKVRLIQRIQKRTKLLGKLQRMDHPKFLWILDELNLKYMPKSENRRVLSKRAKRMREARDHFFETKEKKLQEFRVKLEKERETFEIEKTEMLSKLDKELEELGIEQKTNVGEILEALDVGEPYFVKKAKYKPRRKQVLEMKFRLYAHRREDSKPEHWYRDRV